MLTLHSFRQLRPPLLASGYLFGPNVCCVPHDMTGMHEIHLLASKSFTLNGPTNMNLLPSNG